MELTLVPQVLQHSSRDVSASSQGNDPRNSSEFKEGKREDGDREGFFTENTNYTKALVLLHCIQTALYIDIDRL